MGYGGIKWHLPKAGIRNRGASREQEVGYDIFRQAVLRLIQASQLSVQDDIECVPVSKETSRVGDRQLPTAHDWSLRFDSLFMGCAALSRISSTS